MIFMGIDSAYIAQQWFELLSQKVPTAKEIGILRESIISIFLHQMDDKNYNNLIHFVDKCIENRLLTCNHKALIIDRHELIKNGYTIYGTRTLLDDDGNLVLQPSKNIQEIDEKRKELGLIPLGLFYKTYMPDAELPKEYKESMNIDSFLDNKEYQKN